MKTWRHYSLICSIVMFGAGMSVETQLIASPVDEAIKAVADGLVDKQVKKGADSGIWIDEAGFTGSIATRMVDTYAWTRKSALLACSEFTGYHVLLAPNDNFFADEALALARPSDLANDPFDNIWRAGIDSFHSKIKDSSEGTRGYISYDSGREPSTVVLGLAEHVVAAHDVGAKNVEIGDELSQDGLIYWGYAGELLHFLRESVISEGLDPIDVTIQL
ncbi:MAG: hypothetical protein P8Z79_06130 [Sedimentisphaerales bacterium]|jgi:hypothetical protein